MRNINKASILAIAATIALAGTAHAEINGESSDGDKVAVGTSTVDGGPHMSGKPGIGVPATGLDNLVDFQGLTTYSTEDSNSIYTLNFPSSAPSDHSDLGVFHFAQVSGNSIYFGEWSQTGDATQGDYTVYYVGDDGGSTTVPTTGTATYSVKGISNYAANGGLSGTFNATFASGNTGTLTGTLSASGGYTVDIGTADISGSTFSNTGGASARTGISPTSTSLATGGDVSGRFYGNNAAALAGLVNFASARQYSTAFGGTKN